MVDEHLAYDNRLRARGQFVSAEALLGAETATMVCMRGGRISTTDGPFAETKEQIGGFVVIEAENLDQAIDIAGHIPSAQLGRVELRPVRDLMEQRRQDRKAGGG
jgi:hypothetical protein